jgi:hypothetical protein
MNIIQRLASAYSINQRMYNLAIAYVAAALILRFPWLVSWVPQSQQPKVFELCDTVTTFACGLAIWWAKDKLISGNGAEGNPIKKLK